MFLELDGQFWSQLKCAHRKTAKNAQTLSDTVHTEMHWPSPLPLKIASDGSATPPYMKTKDVFELDGQFWSQLKCIHRKMAKNAETLSATVDTDMHWPSPLPLKIASDGSATPPYMKTKDVF